MLKNIMKGESESPPTIRQVLATIHSTTRPNMDEI